MLAFAFKSEFRPAYSCSTRTTRTTRTFTNPHTAPPLVRLGHPEQRTTAGPVDREHPVFVRLVRVKIACRFGHWLRRRSLAADFLTLPPRRRASARWRAGRERVAAARPTRAVTRSTLPTA